MEGGAGDREKVGVVPDAAWYRRCRPAEENNSPAGLDAARCRRWYRMTKRGDGSRTGSNRRRPPRDGSRPTSTPEAGPQKGVGMDQQESNTRTRNRGFASMDAHRQREIARKGGRAAHEKGKAHEFTPDEARAAGRKGGEKVSVNRRHMAEIGRRGGRSSAARRRPTDGDGQANNPGANAGENQNGNGSSEPQQPGQGSAVHAEPAPTPHGDASQQG